MKSTRLLHFLILGVVCIVAFLLHREALSVNIMEARNFVTAREMVEKGNWLIPSMNGQLRLAKPPLPTWITAYVGCFLGTENVSLLRLPAGIMAAIMLFFMYFLTMELHKNRRLALLNGIVLGSSFYMVYMGRTGTWDIYCHSFMLGAIWLFVKAWKSEGMAWGTFIWVGVLLGLSFLSKGPVSFFALLLPFLIGYIIVYGRKEIARKWRPLVVALGIFIVISFWWPTFIYFSHSAQAAAVAKLESSSWVNRHVRPFWYYWNFPIQSGVWTLFIATALIFPYGKRRFALQKGYRLALLWTLFAVFLLSLFPEKKDRYLFPVLVPCAMLVGHYLNHLIEVYQNKSQDRWDELLLKINSWLIALVAFVMPIGLYLFFYTPGHMHLSVFCILSLVSWGIFVYLFISFRKRKIIGIVTAIVMMMLMVEGGILPYINGMMNKNPQYHNIHKVREFSDVDQLSFYSLINDSPRIELVWEVGEEIKVWDYKNHPSLPESGAFALVSSEPADKMLPKEILDRVSIKVLDQYDYNTRSPKSRKYKAYFRKYVSIISYKNFK